MSKIISIAGASKYCRRLDRLPSVNDAVYILALTHDVAFNELMGRIDVDDLSAVRKNLEAEIKAHVAIAVNISMSGIMTGQYTTCMYFKHETEFSPTGIKDLMDYVGVAIDEALDVAPIQETLREGHGSW